MGALGQRRQQIQTSSIEEVAFNLMDILEKITYELIRLTTHAVGQSARYAGYFSITDAQTLGFSGNLRPEAAARNNQIIALILFST